MYLALKESHVFSMNRSCHHLDHQPAYGALYKVVPKEKLGTKSKPGKIWTLAASKLLALGTERGLVWRRVHYTQKEFTLKKQTPSLGQKHFNYIMISEVSWHRVWTKHQNWLSELQGSSSSHQSIRRDYLCWIPWQVIWPQWQDCHHSAGNSEWDSKKQINCWVSHSY